MLGFRRDNANGFPRLFDSGEIAKLRDSVDGTSKRNAISTLSSRTAKPRTEKLFDIFTRLGIRKIEVRAQNPRPVDLAVCRRIVEGRNGLFHAGKSVDRTVLYWELLPILKQLVSMSQKLTQMRESDIVPTDNIYAGSQKRSSPCWERIVGLMRRLRDWIQQNGQ